MIYAYGGDFGSGEPSDNNFVCNGLISPDRALNPHAYEVKKVYQSIWTYPVNVAEGKVEIYNENFFVSLDDYILDWTISADGVGILHGSIDHLNVKPGEKKEISLGYDLTDIHDNRSELLLNVAYKLKKSKDLLPASYVQAEDQLLLKEYPFKLDQLIQGEKMGIENGIKDIIIGSESARVVFNKKSGWISSIEYEDDQILKGGYLLKPNFWRAPTDNDFGTNLPDLLKNWRDPVYHMKTITTEYHGNNVFIRVGYTCPEIHIDLVMEYEINSHGEISVSEIIETDGTVNDIKTLMRVGMQMVMPGSFDQVEYYGRGPVENYTDRKSYAKIGLYKQSVEEQFFPYIRPQENGTKSDIRWWKLLDIDGNGIQISSDQPFSSSALHYLPSDLEDYPDRSQRHSGQLTRREVSTLSFDLHQMGLGGEDSWGALPYEQYRVPYSNYTFNFLIRPVRSY
jgi:beta-galactosidase